MAISNRYHKKFYNALETASRRAIAELIGMGYLYKIQDSRKRKRNYRI